MAKRYGTAELRAIKRHLQLILGQILAAEKSNGITALPELLDVLDIQGSTATIDAMGTQTVIADKIVERGADYILALKENQPILLEDVRLYDAGCYKKIYRGFAVIRGTRTIIEGETSVVFRYYIYRYKQMTAHDFLCLRRRHWSIENNPHWVLDVNFREDGASARVEHPAAAQA